jgi:hypothetical protein
MQVSKMMINANTPIALYLFRAQQKQTKCCVPSQIAACSIASTTNGKQQTATSNNQSIQPQKRQLEIIQTM